MAMIRDWPHLRVTHQFSVVVKPHSAERCAHVHCSCWTIILTVTHALSSMRHNIFFSESVTLELACEGGYSTPLMVALDWSALFVGPCCIGSHWRCPLDRAMQEMSHWNAAVTASLLVLQILQADSGCHSTGESTRWQKKLLSVKNGPSCFCKNKQQPESHSVVSWCQKPHIQSCC